MAPFAPPSSAVASARAIITIRSTEEKCIETGMSKVSGHSNISTATKPATHLPSVVATGSATGTPTGTPIPLPATHDVHKTTHHTGDTMSTFDHISTTPGAAVVAARMAAALAAARVKLSYEKFVVATWLKVLKVGKRTPSECTKLPRLYTSPNLKSIVRNSPRHKARSRTIATGAVGRMVSTAVVPGPSNSPELTIYD